MSLASSDIVLSSLKALENISSFLPSRPVSETTSKLFESLPVNIVFRLDRFWRAPHSPGFAIFPLVHPLKYQIKLVAPIKLLFPGPRAAVPAWKAAAWEIGKPLWAHQHTAGALASLRGPGMHGMLSHEHGDAGPTFADMCTCCT